MPYSSGQQVLDTPSVTSTSPNVYPFPTEGNNIQSSYGRNDEQIHREVRREAVGSERRDESVMGPPPSSYGFAALSSMDQRDVPTGQASPTSQQPLVTSNTAEHVDRNDGELGQGTENRTEGSPVAPLRGASLPFHNPTVNQKGQRYKHRNVHEDTDAVKRPIHSKTGREHRSGRRSSTPDDNIRDSGRQRQHSPPSIDTSFTSEI